MVFAMINKKLLTAVFTAFLSVLLMFGGIMVSAEKYDGFSLKTPENFVSATPKDDLSELSKVVGISSDDLKSYFNDGNFLYIAADKTNKNQIKLSCYEDEFSKKSINLIGFEDNDLLTLGEFFLTAKSEDSKPNITTETNNGTKFIKTVENHKDSGGEYTVTQYITVIDGKTYKLSVFTPANADKQLEKEVFNSFRIEQNDGFLFTFNHLLIILAVMLFATLIVMSVLSIIKSKKAIEDN